MARKSKAKTPEIVDERRAYKVWDEIDEDAWESLLAECAPGLRLRRKGKSYVGHCPNPEHSDESPSFHITPSARIAKCFSCGWCRTNPIALISALRQSSQMDEASYTDAARYLRKQFAKLKDLISDEAIKALDEIETKMRARDAVVGVACDVLFEAIQLWPDEAAMDTAGLLYTKRAIDWLATRTGDVKASAGVVRARQLMGVIPTVHFVKDRLGASHEISHMYWATFGEAPNLGWPIYPWHRIDRHVGRVRYRNLGHDPKIKTSAKVLSLPEPSWDIGFYGGLTLISNLPVYVVEGEGDALRWQVEQEKRGNIDPVIAMGGESSPPLNPLEQIGIKRAYLIGDHDKGGTANIVRVAKQTTAPIDLHVFAWPSYLERGMDPDAAITDMGFDNWMRIAADHESYVSIVDWCVERATANVTNGDGVETLAKTAMQWSELLHGVHERAAFAEHAATRLGIDVATLKREIEVAAPPPSIELGDHVELAGFVLRDLRGASEAKLVHAEGVVWRYDEGTGLWCQLDEDVLARVAMKYSGVTFGPGGMCIVRLKASDVNGIIKLATHQAGLARFFDEAPSGIAFRNGFLTCSDKDVRLTKHSPENRARVALPFDYIKHARAPRFERFLFQCLRETHCVQHRSQGEQVCAEAAASGAERHICWPTDRVAPPTIRWMKEYEDTLPLMHLAQEFVGVSLVGRATKYAKSLVNTGEGENGKSVFLDIINAVFPIGSYTSVEPQLWGKEYNRAQLAGARINLVPELPKAEILATSNYKQIITGDITSGRNPYGKPFTFRPIAGHLFLTNALPAVTDHSHGFWRRQAVIEWRHKFKGKHAETGLTEYVIANELPGVVAWAIAGAIRVMNRGRYDVPEASKKAVETWKQDSNSVALWIEDATTDNIGNDKIYEPGWSNAQTLYLAFGLWADARGYTRMHLGNFRHRLRELGIKMKRADKGMLYNLMPRPASDAAGMEGTN